MMQFVEENLREVLPYLDNITICGKSEDDHNANLQAFFKVANSQNLVCKISKTILTTTKLPIFGFEIKGQIRPDPKRLEPLRQILVPKSAKSLSRAIGFFSYYLN